MNPVTFESSKSFKCMKSTHVTHVGVTRFYDAATTSPGQPGVFEIQGIKVTEDTPFVARYAHWDGVKWACPSVSAAGAYALRFTTDADQVQKFRGLQGEVL